MPVWLYHCLRIGNLFFLKSLVLSALIINLEKDLQQESLAKEIGDIVHNQGNEQLHSIGLVVSNEEQDWDEREQLAKY